MRRFGISATDAEELSSELSSYEDEVLQRADMFFMELLLSSAEARTISLDRF